MKKILIIMIIFCEFSFAQNVIRVVNGQNLQNILDDATSGDFIIVENGNYGNININKKVFLFGTGYLPVNNNSATAAVSILGNVYFKTGATGSIIQGFQTELIKVESDNILVQRNNCGNIEIGNTENFGGPNILVKNITIKQNLGYSISVFNNSQDFLISNNIFKGDFHFYTTGYGQVLYNSFINSGYGFGYLNWGGTYLNVNFKNNIFPTILNNQGSNSNFIIHVIPLIVENNIFSNSFQNISNSNKISIDLGSVYEAYSNNLKNLQEDARYQLASNSPAKGAGENGTDCGAFGGDDPYVLSGIPSIPSIYHLTVPSQVPQNGTLNIQIKAKTNN